LNVPDLSMLDMREAPSQRHNAKLGVVRPPDNSVQSAHTVRILEQ